MRWLLAAVPLLLTGCVAELLGPPEVTTRTVACALLDAERSVDISWYADDVPPSASLAAAAWIAEMANVTGRSTDAFAIHFEPLPEGPWDPVSLTTWADGRRVLEGGAVGIHVLWVPDVGELERATLPVAPAVMSINSTVGDDVDVVTGLFFHGAGHLMGVVNRGIPLHGPDVTGREGPPGHEPGDGSVMADAWHRIAALPPNATTDRYADAIVRDWMTATGPQGVCA